jgi:hypothetical protein
MSAANASGGGLAIHRESESNNGIEGRPLADDLLLIFRAS